MPRVSKLEEQYKKSRNHSVHVLLKDIPSRSLLCFPRLLLQSTFIMRLILTRKSPLNTILFEESTGQSMYQSHTPNASKNFTNRRTTISRIRPTQENDDIQTQQLIGNSESSSDGEAVPEVSDAEVIGEVQWKILAPSKFLFPPGTEEISSTVYLPFSGMLLK
jgi:hypothetical protein